MAELSSTHRQIWADNLWEEAEFWRGALLVESASRAKHLQRAERRQVSSFIRERVSRVNPGGVARILDVGSGPLTTLGTEWPGREVELRAVDPLADEYNAILDELGIDVPVRPEVGEAERLIVQFGRGTFDLVHSANALDHCADAPEAMRQMVAVTTPRGTVLLHHLVNVAEKESYHGLHQWNLCVEDGALVVWSRTERHLATDVLPGCRLESTEEAGMITTVVTTPSD